MTAPSGFPRVAEQSATPRSFPLYHAGTPASIVVAEEDAKVVSIASARLADDLEQVGGTRPTVSSDLSAATGPVVLIGTIGNNPYLDALIDAGRLDISEIGGGWERYHVAVVDKPFPGVPKALVIAGSDRRGTAFGIFSLSEAIGVSPWSWWADVPVRSCQNLFVDATPFTSKTPSVRYRGIFLNDEDWGLRPWAAKTFEPETGNIGPKTYARIFELLLRLKANYIWPAMHPGTRSFNTYPENKQVAHDYAMVVGSSHCEPMLCNNVDEWKPDIHGPWNPKTNLPAILTYWDQRIQENHAFENDYTVGMRGIHDGAMPGGGTLEERRDRLEKIIALQRELLAKYVDPDPSKVPQTFCAYKEVLQIYQTGLNLPDDIKMVWANDNFGYTRQLPGEAERQRGGGHGIYYHLSYWGRPHDYLWLESNAPALVWHELTKAYAFGVRDVWVVNVGDLKPTESGMSLCLKMAWDIDSYGPDVQQRFLRDFYAQQFGEAYADEITDLKDDYFQLCSIRKPEHMGFNQVYYTREIKEQPIQDSGWSPEKIERILDRWRELSRRTDDLSKKLPPEMQDAFFQLLTYPACAAAAIVEKMLLAEKARNTGSPEAAHAARAAFDRIHALTDEYNSLHDGKWRHMMDDRPRRLPVFEMSSVTPCDETNLPPKEDPPATDVVLTAADFQTVQDHDGAGWGLIPGLGLYGAGLTVLPHQDIPTLQTSEAIREQAPVAETMLDATNAGSVTVSVEALPTHPFSPRHTLMVAVSINDGDPQPVCFDVGEDDELDSTWHKNVTRGFMTGETKLILPEGPCRLRLWAADRGVVVLQVMIHPTEHSP